MHLVVAFHSPSRMSGWHSDGTFTAKLPIGPSEHHHGCPSVPDHISRVKLRCTVRKIAFISMLHHCCYDTGARLDMGLSAEFQGMRPRGHSQPQVPAHPGHLRSNTQQLQLQRHGRHMYQQQPQHAREHAAATGQVVAPELMRQLYQLGAQLGQALQQGGGAAVSTPAALTASMEAVCKHMFKGDAAAMVEQLAVAFQQQQHRP